MNKKIIIGLVLVFVIVILGIGIWLLLKNNETNKNLNNSNIFNEENDGKGLIDLEENKVIVVYFSAQSHTKAVAEKIASNLNADIFEIVPEEVYTSDDLDWTDNNSRVTREHNDESLRNIKLTTTTVENWDSYDTVLIGYPIWWGIAAWPVDTFVKSNNFAGKTVIPFCTSTSSGIGESGKLLESIADGEIWIEGYRFNSNPSDTEIKSFTDNLNKNKN